MEAEALLELMVMVAEELEDNQEGLEVLTTVQELPVLLQEGQEIVLK
jgi:hypothetical protein